MPLADRSARPRGASLRRWNPRDAWRAGSSLAALALGSLASSPASANRVEEPGDASTPGRVTLRWSAPEPECPGEAELVARVDSLLGAEPLQLEADAQVERQADARWRLDLALRWSHRDELRTLFAGDCRSLADATVVLVAVLAAPVFAAQRLAPRDERQPVVDDLADAPAVPAPAPVASEPSSRPSLRRSDRRGQRRRGPFARVVGVLGHGALPRGDFGVGVAAGSLLPGVRIEAAATFVAPRTAGLSDGSGRGGALGLAAAAARACPRFLGAPVELSLCGALEVGLTTARSLGLTPQRRQQGPWVALSLGGALEWWLSAQVALHADVEATAAPVVTSYHFDGAPLFTSRRFGVRAGLGLVIALVASRGARSRP